MTEHRDGNLPRRGFVGRLAALTAFLAAGLKISDSSGQGRPAAVQQDDWLSGLTAPHRVIFDMPGWGGGLGMVHILNYLNTYNRAYQVPDTDLNVVTTFYGATTLLGVNDGMWTKYRIGELLEQKDSDGEFAVKNPWRTAVSFRGAQVAAAGIEPLQKRGVVFLLCNNALNNAIGQIASARQLDRGAVDSDLRANILPGVVVVPAMVIAIEKAQAHGLAYNRQT